MNSLSRKITIVSSLTAIPLLIIILKDFIYFRRGWHNIEIQYQAIFWILRLALSAILVFFAWKFRTVFNRLSAYFFLQTGGFVLYSFIFMSLSFLTGKFLMSNFDGRDLNLFNTIKQTSFTINLLVYTSTLLIINAWIFFESRTEAGKKLQLLERSLNAAETKLSDEKHETAEKEKISRLTVKNGDRTIIVPVKDIICLLSEGPYVRVVTQSKAHLINMPLYELQAILPDVFLRVHRSHIVNTGFIREVRSLLNGDYTILLENDINLKASRTYRQNMKSILSSI